MIKTNVKKPDVFLNQWQFTLTRFSIGFCVISGYEKCRMKVLDLLMDLLFMPVQTHSRTHVCAMTQY